MQNQARSISTNQVGLHPNLEKVVTRHLRSISQKPFSDHTKTAFNQTLKWLDNWQGKLILDSCCGVGESTTNIAQDHPDARVIGIDKSALRTDKHQSYAANLDNYLIIRADLNDFLRLLVLENIKLYKHYLLYPNPYPKSAHLQRRWYATSALTDILKLGGQLEVRSNWQLYIQEFSLALQLAKINNQVNEYSSHPAITPFERKYWLSGQKSWQLIADLD
ncbi:tRNA (guanine-N(7)-)-methyltransferase [Paraglaciecola aquimarina]|uniref:tRNA (guanine(46)-N(7))-methyltransferase n=1 Tax=Paraglaciecola algarum TaxID=3050085 RepID=A0ABS9D3X2_9ALTE|nr:tRNA (guanine-N(7)-)-methyltransferase [Paraglaciecola sp. G1-23]MCF2947455.1 tRNA (guanine-N(7)-)-methyltransferase [Paraglaciecola sp. G1-23]